MLKTVIGERESEWSGRGGERGRRRGRGRNSISVLLGRRLISCSFPPRPQPCPLPLLENAPRRLQNRCQHHAGCLVHRGCLGETG